MANWFTNEFDPFSGREAELVSRAIKNAIDEINSPHSTDENYVDITLDKLSYYQRALIAVFWDDDPYGLKSLIKDYEDYLDDEIYNHANYKSSDLSLGSRFYCWLRANIIGRVTQEELQFKYPYLQDEYVNEQVIAKYLHEGNKNRTTSIKNLIDPNIQAPKEYTGFKSSWYNFFKLIELPFVMAREWLKDGEPNGFKTVFAWVFHGLTKIARIFTHMPENIYNHPVAFTLGAASVVAPILGPAAIMAYAGPSTLIYAAAEAFPVLSTTASYITAGVTAPAAGSVASTVSDFSEKNNVNTKEQTIKNYRNEPVKAATVKTKSEKDLAVETLLSDFNHIDEDVNIVTTIITNLRVLHKDTEKLQLVLNTVLERARTHHNEEANIILNEFEEAVNVILNSKKSQPIGDVALIYYGFLYHTNQFYNTGETAQTAFNATKHTAHLTSLKIDSTTIINALVKQLKTLEAQAQINSETATYTLATALHDELDPIINNTEDVRTSYVVAVFISAINARINDKDLADDLKAQYKAFISERKDAIDSNIILFEANKKDTTEIPSIAQSLIKPSTSDFRIVKISPVHKQSLDKQYKDVDYEIIPGDKTILANIADKLQEFTGNAEKLGQLVLAIEMVKKTLPDATGKLDTAIAAINSIINNLPKPVASPITQQPVVYMNDDLDNKIKRMAEAELEVIDAIILLNIYTPGDTSTDKKVAEQKLLTAKIKADTLARETGIPTLDDELRASFSNGGLNIDTPEIIFIISLVKTAYENSKSETSSLGSSAPQPSVMGDRDSRNPMHHDDIQNTLHDISTAVKGKGRVTRAYMNKIKPQPKKEKCEAESPEDILSGTRIFGITN